MLPPLTRQSEKANKNNWRHREEAVTDQGVCGQVPQSKFSFEFCGNLINSAPTQIATSCPARRQQQIFLRLCITCAPSWIRASFDWWVFAASPQKHSQSQQEMSVRSAEVGQFRQIRTWSFTPGPEHESSEPRLVWKARGLSVPLHNLTV